jgi:hypothetical protein
LPAVGDPPIVGRVRLGLWLLPVLAACGCGETTLLVELSAAPGVTLASLSVDVEVEGTDADVSRTINSDGGPPRLPGRLVVQLSDSAGSVRITAHGADPDGHALLAMQQIRPSAHRQVSVSLVIGGPSTVVDGGADGGAPGKDGGLDCTGLVFCDDFEAAALDLSKWARQFKGSGTVEIDPSRAYRGGGSLHVHVDEVPANGEGQATAAALPLLEPQPTLYVRAFVYLPSALPTDASDFLLLAQTASPFGNLGVFFAAGEHLNLHDFVSPSTGGHLSQGTFPLDRWFCIEWQVGTNPGQTSIALDGSPVSDLQNIAFTPPTGNPLHRLDLELHFYKPTSAVPAYDAWFDELAVSATPIGCDR